MENEIYVSKLERILVNICTPALYAAEDGKVPFKEIAKFKEDNYRRLVTYMENGGKIPFRVQAKYHSTICGNVAVGTAYGRKLCQLFFS